ncbi:HK97 gp10 family phage protein [Shinella pollutisoli]|uniref:HK97 gp10 family phage protein n=1 Tax=Shinella pollutisoli TaxID=2250594 RepID=A0ABV7DDJ3_9HYPH|nr:HK97 gp10 family phage protein [Shinella pollutisoli]
MAKLSFSAQVGDWILRVKEAQEAVFKESVQELAIQLSDQLETMIYETPESPNYKRTKFLQASLMASNGEMPRLSIDNPGVPVTPDFGQIELVINNAEIGETIYLGYTARYGAYVAYGTEHMPPRPWVQLVAQRWQSIVAAKAADVKARFGL